MKRELQNGMKLVNVNDTSACNDKQRWNGDTFRCECKILIDKGIWDYLDFYQL